MLRDGMHQTAIHTGAAAYHPNSIDRDEPKLADEKHGGYVQTPRVIEGTAVRAQPASFDDHFSQATMFYRSLSPIEQTHVVEAFTFELGKVYEQTIKERELQVLANVDTDLCEQVAAGLVCPPRRANLPRPSPFRPRWCRSWPSRVGSTDARSASSPMRAPISPAFPSW